MRRIARAICATALLVVAGMPAQAYADTGDEGFLVARPLAGSKLVLRARPGGRVAARVGRSTPFGSPLTLGVVRVRGDWLGVTTPLRPNGRLAWVRSDSVRLSATRVSLILDRSARRLYLKVGDRIVRRMPVAVGRPDSPTPVGRFAVTDKLFSRVSYYGCCAIALSATQPRLPSGWNGGNRVAIHGTNQPSSIGTAASAGCPRAREHDLRYLLGVVPLGAPVFIRR
jgi:lipoprotein-anchoring transpeptidase ErfK/SrfK